jgi:hypothetical protein
MRGLILRVCRIAGSGSFVDNARESLAAEGIHAAVRTRDTAALFDWLVMSFSYQGIADQVAFDYIERYGQATWQVIAGPGPCRVGARDRLDQGRRAF